MRSERTEKPVNQHDQGADFSFDTAELGLPLIHQVSSEEITYAIGSYLADLYGMIPAFFW